MTPTDFIRKWSPGGAAHELNERAGAQPHFIDLCRLLGVPEPAAPERYCFERGLVKTGSAAARTDGFADVWLRGHFAWEYKAPGRSLKEALKQLMLYALPLENPPLLVVSDRLRIEVHTHFTGTPSECHVFALADLADAELRQRLRTLWTEPDAWRPRRSNRDITEAAAQTFAGTAARLRAAGVAPEQVSHFLTQCLLCFFAEDVGLLPERLFERLVGVMITPERMRTQLTRLFETMRDGGLFGVDDLPWFNGGLFKAIDVPPLTEADVAALKAASAMNWSAIDPSIFGTLFERGLDPAVRAALGANYTDPATIQRLVEPVVQRPLLAEWQRVRAQVESLLARRDELRATAAQIPSTTKALKDKYARTRTKANEAEREAQAAFVGFLERLRGFRVLDAACGSGNFLYLALKALKDIEHLANHEAEALGLERQHDVTGPHNVLGIELNEYAAELARVTVWIGELQWRIQRGYAFKTHPVLEPLDHIECRDALMTPQGEEAAWPAADVLVGNPPFVGVPHKRSELGDSYVRALDRLYAPMVPGASDFVCYWFHKALKAIEAGALKRAGLVATNSIRGGANRTVLQHITGRSRIYEAWSDEPWVNEGAAVRVSLICFGGDDSTCRLDGRDVPQIYADLTAPLQAGNATDVTQAQTLPANLQASFQGASKKAKFEIDAALAQEWLRQPNPNGRPNSDVLRPWANGFELSRRPQKQWIIDFGNEMAEADAALYELPFAYVTAYIKPERITKSEPALRDYWWRFGRPRVEMRKAFARLPRFIATIAHSKHRFFVWLPATTSPDQALITVARADDTTFGLLHSRFHELWALRLGTSLEDRPRYTPTTCFETFPFPTGLTPADTAHQRTEALDGGARIPADLPATVRAHAEAIARAAQRLVTLRDAWLNPPEWTERVPEVVPLGLATSPYPDRIVAKTGFEKELAKRTLTNLYNQRPAWLAQAHAALDRAVATAYVWSEDPATLSNDEILRRLLGVNRERAAGSA
jgi:SAM-dependent methyltransferase